MDEIISQGKWDWRISHRMSVGHILPQAFVLGLAPSGYLHDGGLGGGKRGEAGQKTN